MLVWILPGAQKSWVKCLRVPQPPSPQIVTVTLSSILALIAGSLRRKETERERVEIAKRDMENIEGKVRCNWWLALCRSAIPSLPNQVIDAMTCANVYLVEETNRRIAGKGLRPGYWMIAFTTHPLRNMLIEPKLIEQEQSPPSAEFLICERIHRAKPFNSSPGSSGTVVWNHGWFSIYLPCRYGLRNMGKLPQQMCRVL